MEVVHYREFHGFRFPEFACRQGLAHVFGGRSESGLGNLALSGGRDRTAALTARAAWSDYLGVEAEDWVVGAQVHGAEVQVVGERHRGRGALLPGDVLPTCDGLITQTLGLPLYIAVADCSAVLLHGPGILGLVHGGWRGLAAGILGRAVRRMEDLGVETSRLVAGIGPCIASASYEVGAEVAAHAPEVARSRREDHRWQVDIGRWADWCLQQAGLPPTAIFSSGIDTGTDPSCFSHRRQGVEAGRNGLIALLC